MRRTKPSQAGPASWDGSGACRSCAAQTPSQPLRACRENDGAWSRHRPNSPCHCATSARHRQPNGSESAVDRPVLSLNMAPGHAPSRRHCIRHGILGSGLLGALAHAPRALGSRADMLLPPPRSKGRSTPFPISPSSNTTTPTSPVWMRTPRLPLASRSSSEARWSASMTTDRSWSRRCISRTRRPTTATTRSTWNSGPRNDMKSTPAR